MARALSSSARYLFTVGFLSLLFSCASVEQKWVHSDKSYQSQANLDRDSYQCNGQAQAATRDMQRGYEGMAGSVGGSPSLGLATVMLGSASVNSAFNSVWTSCMQGKGWRRDYGAR